jgi:carbon catabolite-derepressing protein kinase
MQTIGDYTIVKTLGEGTFGKVKLGIHNPTGEKVSSLSNNLQKGRY